MSELVLTHAYFIGEDPAESKVMKPYPPLGLLSLSAYLKREGFSVEVFDSTFATPVLQQPARHGAALVMHSSTKFLAGHGDAQARERRVELVAAARDVAATRGGGECGPVVNLRAGLVDDAAVHSDLPREDGGARLGAGAKEAALREQHVQPLAHRRPS